MEKLIRFWRIGILGRNILNNKETNIFNVNNKN